MTLEFFRGHFQVLVDYFRVNINESAANEYYKTFKGMDEHRFGQICARLINDYKPTMNCKFPLIGTFWDFNRQIVSEQVYHDKQPKGEPMATDEEIKLHFQIIEEIWEWCRLKLAKDYMTVYQHYMDNQPPMSEDWAAYQREYLKKLKNERWKRVKNETQMV